ncbi:hypothetical protein CANARDRAFT_234837 [[Candida] arabinofermentans NRRL YB-2248]|uniref:DNA repair protein RAD50 n=1 Tax=[Candida] arabinofermentans NRRL YB-2248 TaxID=983967 RepID=A0A1E4SZW7_9ASCO|nr:hypothetical protein CANARDRAFT_234837 [[Candida] arabinofermentans NRRL YB-2248]
MSSIYKLSISGIRSFSGDTQETIQFNKPLTLIVGTNGSGKTTIIECLRYATTGDLPPNSKNGAFINDPNLGSGGTETKAQIKLAFQNVNRTNMILSKSLMASKNPKTKAVSFKTRENQLLAIHNGEKQTLSSKVADIETAMTQHLGVSKAILNYVIFCHQDESLWPISDSATLKKKFDEIFDSVKFIKILENFKAMNKEMNANLKLINNNVEHLKNDKMRAHKKMDEIEHLNKEVERYNKDTELLIKEIDEIKIQSEKLFTSNQDYERILSKIDYLKQQEISINQQINMITSTTKILELSTDELNSNLNDFANILHTKKIELNSLNEDLNEKTNIIKVTREEYNNLILKEGKLKGYKENYDNNLQSKNKLINQFKNKLNLKDNQEFDLALESKLLELNESYKTIQGSHHSNMDDRNFELTALKEEIASNQQHVSYMEKDIKNLNIKRTELIKNLTNIQTSELKLDSEKLELQMKIEKLNDFRSKSELSIINQEIIESQKKILNLENELDDLNRSINKLSCKNGELTQINKQIKTIKYELNRDYNEIDLKYLKEYTTLQTTLSLQSDLIIYSQAIDTSIMEYHKEKMKEINRIIDELWKVTYTGNDMDTIMICADPIKSSITNNMRSYNYRVVMIKNGVELDMRGRCSAGQRVLASIIIRLSLAECFGLNFGMITLDEPTTNLDDENIESLAKSLNKIIELRSNQKNFQLIVITHDEKFLRFMNAVEFTDHYYKIIRNERLNSTINQVKIRLID